MCANPTYGGSVRGVRVSGVQRTRCGWRRRRAWTHTLLGSPWPAGEAEAMADLHTRPSVRLLPGGGSGALRVSAIRLCSGSARPLAAGHDLARPDRSLPAEVRSGGRRASGYGAALWTSRRRYIGSCSGWMSVSDSRGCGAGAPSDDAFADTVVAVGSLGGVLEGRGRSTPGVAGGEDGDRRAGPRDAAHYVRMRLPAEQGQPGWGGVLGHHDRRFQPCWTWLKATVMAPRTPHPATGLPLQSAGSRIRT